jgi:GNAT superfamily N-acetyltransferase
VFAQFAAAALLIADAARSMGLRPPDFRSPPRLSGRDRTVLRRADGSAVVAVRLEGRAVALVVTDLIDGVVVANQLSGDAAARCREALRLKYRAAAAARGRGPPPRHQYPAPPVEIRPVRPDEHAALGRLTRIAYETLPGAYHDPGYYAELEDITSRVQAATVLVAVDGDGGLLGGVTYVGDTASPLAEFDDADGAGCRMLAVASDARGRGVGEALVRACIARARADGRARLLLHTTSWMPAAHRLYERLGFTRDHARDWAPIPEVPLLAYTYELPAE